MKTKRFNILETRIPAWFALMFCMLFWNKVLAQAPEKMTYQSVIRNATGALLANANVGVQANIYQGAPNGALVYTETQTGTTNSNGLLSLEIGSVSPLQLNWGNGPYYLELRIDPNGGTNYTISGNNQLLSVPYALHAKTSEDAFSGDYNDLTNTPVIPTVPSNVSAFTNDAGYLTSEVDGSTSNEIQFISRSNDTIFLSNGGFVKLPAGFDGQYSSLTGAPTNVSAFTNDAGYLTSEIDGSVTNEIQLLSRSNDTIFLSNGGFVKLPAGFDGQYSSLTGAPTNVSAFTNDVGYLTSEIDGSVTNEIQVLSISADTIYLSNGGFVKLPAGFDGNYNSLTNKPSNLSAFTNDVGYLTSFTETDPVYSSKFDVSGSTTGDLLQFNGTKYVKFTPNYLTTGDNLGNHTATQNINLNGFALVSSGTRGLKMDFRGNIGINMAPQNTSGNDVNLDILSPDGWGHANINLRGYNWATTNHFCTRASGATSSSGLFWSDEVAEHVYRIYLEGDGNKGFAIRKNGNIGIGTTTPSTKLDVVGDINFSGVLRKNGTPITFDGSETKIQGGTDVNVSGTGTTLDPYIIGTVSKHYVGELYGGGIVFYVDQTGQHGLIASLADLSSAAYVGLYGVNIPNCASRWNGAANTSAIMAAGGGASSPAGLCDNYASGGFSDWYLPSIDELSQLYQAIYVINKTLDQDGNPASNGIYPSTYVSSTQGTNITMWGFMFQTGDLWDNCDRGYSQYVRAIRAF